MNNKLSIDITTQNLSDGSQVHSVTIKDAHGFLFVDMDAITKTHASALAYAIREAVKENTNIELIPLN